jgi:hypothetical protein
MTSFKGTSCSCAHEPCKPGVSNNGVVSGCKDEGELCHVAKSQHSPTKHMHLHCEVATLCLCMK